MRLARVADLLARVLLVGVGAATACGLLGPISTIADLANDFRPVLIAASLFAAVVALVAAPRWVRVACVVTVAVNLALASLTWLPALLLHPAQAGSAELKVVSFNVWARNTELWRTRDWLAVSAADVVVLQEFNDHARREVVAPLTSIYPHVYDCRCNDIAILSRHPFAAAGAQPRTAETPAMSWVTLALAGQRSLRLVGVHTTYPKKPDQHTQHFAQLFESPLFDGRNGPVAVIGDFNATPWSWRFNHFIRRHGLMRHGSGIVASWPSTPLPLFLLDNVVTTPDVGAVSFHIGPDIGSDHRPLTATIALP